MHSDLTEKRAVAVVMCHYPIAHSDRFFGQISVPPIPHTPPFFKRVTAGIRRFPRETPFFVTFSRGRIRVPYGTIIKIMR